MRELLGTWCSKGSLVEELSATILRLEPLLLVSDDIHCTCDLHENNLFFDLLAVVGRCPERHSLFKAMVVDSAYASH